MVCCMLMGKTSEQGNIHDAKEEVVARGTALDLLN